MLYTAYSFTFAEQTYYARIESEDICIYYNPSIESSAIFVIPRTYFVKLLGKANDEFYRCQYMEVEGYVKISEVKPISNIPANPYATSRSLRVFTPGGANFRSSPNSSIGATNLIITAGYLDTNFVYYNYCYGEEAISKKGNIWYYCKYINSNNVYFGYIYSPFCDVEQLQDNTEIVEYLSYEPFLNNESTTISASELDTIDPTLKTVLIIIACLPCFVIIYLLIKPTMLVKAKEESQKKSKAKPQKIKRLKHSDYYEIDEDFFN